MDVRERRGKRISFRLLGGVHQLHAAKHRTRASFSSLFVVHTSDTFFDSIDAAGTLASAQLLTAQPFARCSLQALQAARADAYAVRDTP